ncbi:MAG: ROK family protein [Candidatus Omnitrophica bacterium]|nr:ROK family protein [Candidatus Omnitrophota bacterium]
MTKGSNVFSFHITQDRERRNLAILELIRKKSPISRAEISRFLGSNIVTVTNYADYYINKRIILEVGLDMSSGGRRPELLELNPKSGYVVGVDVSPANIMAIVADLKVNTASKVKIPRPATNMEELIAPVVKIIEDVMAKSKINTPEIKNIGIGISGIIDYPSGTIRDTDPTRGRTRVSFLKFARAIEQKFNIPVYIGNDASCAAFGERTLNPSADVENLVYLYSDVGCGMVVNGDVYTGSSGCAGETQIAYSGLQIDEKSYVEEYTHLRPWGVDLGIVAGARKVIGKGAATEILDLVKGKEEKITPQTVIDAAKKGDKLALELIERAGKNLGVRIAYIINFLNPEMIIIGGGMETAGDILFEPVKAAVKKFAFEEPASIVKIVPSFLGEDAIVMGAAALAAREVFIQA